MPFPLNTLHYDLCRRLRVLVSPTEAYDLQIAAPYLEGLNPIQKIGSCDGASLTLDDDNKIVVYGNEGRDPSGNSFYTVNHSMTVFDFRTTHPAQKILDRIKFKGDFIRFNNSIISPGIIKGIAIENEHNIKAVSFYGCYFHSLDTPFWSKDICTYFKNLKGLYFKNGCCPFKSNWVDSFVDAGVAGMKRLLLDCNSTDIFDISQEKLTQFMKNQNTGFVLHIGIYQYQLEQIFIVNPFGENFVLVEPNSSDYYYNKSKKLIIVDAEEDRKMYKLREHSL